MSDFDTPREILDKLVSFPTVSRNSNLDLVDWVEDWLDQRGVSATRVYSADGRKAALYAHVGPMDPGAVVLSGHTDVVPVDGQDWTSDPFTVTERNGLLFGRGTVDMKGFDALALWAMGEAAKLELRRPLQIALSYDEEIGCLGAPVMIDHMLASGMPKGDLVIVGEPSSMACVTGHKGGFGYDVQIQGFEVHSSIMHTGVSAVMEAGRLIEWANQENETLMAGPHSPMADMFDPPWTTVHVGTIEGGTAQNITAADCRMGLGFRLVPDETTDHWQDRLTAQIEAQERRMKAVAPSSGIALHQTYSVPPLKPETDGAAESLVRNITGDNASHVVSYGTEAGQFQERGFSAVVCGPGDIAQAHQPDEYISVEQFLSGQRFMEELVRKLSYQQ
ncbi:MAG: acetylornithine deacetylase [Pseudomonadota bacterium]